MFIKSSNSKEVVIAYTKSNTGNIQYLTDNYLLLSNVDKDLKVCGKLAHEYENISTFYNSKKHR